VPLNIESDTWVEAGETWDKVSHSKMRAERNVGITNLYKETELLIESVMDTP